MSSDELKPPPIMSTITSKDVTYNMDFVGYLVDQERNRRASAGLPTMTLNQIEAFKRDVIRALIIRGDPTAAINLRPPAAKQLLTETTEQRTP
jgi:hypothetical protein